MINYNQICKNNRIKIHIDFDFRAIEPWTLHVVHCPTQAPDNGPSTQTIHHDTYYTVAELKRSLNKVLRYLNDI